ncbi:DHH family phosphoesterase [Metamycoplasma gateae]|uniref:DHH family phosphoesterase n=1 Tax=Metamycoplasma gateae TaxID=35769 RepID=A0ABZ2AHS5_9BACT|nr:DHH family phosphoesterase [Metamycoplasma gateae]
MKNKEDKKKLIILIIQIICLLIIPMIIFFIGIIKFPEKWRTPLIAIYSLFLVALGISTFFIVRKFLKESQIANRTLNQYLQNEINDQGLGTMIFLNNGKIIWATNFILNKFGKSIIGKNIKDVFLIEEWENNNHNFVFKKDDYEYEVFVNFEKNIVIVKDITIQSNLLSDYKKQRVVFGEIHIDNMNLYQVSLSQEELYKIYSNFGAMLEEISRKNNIIYRQYENGRFFLLTNQESLDNLEKTKFQAFEMLKNKNVYNGVNLTISAGFSYGIFKYDILDKLAKEALLQSKTRGGDQITVLTKYEKPRYYGSSSEIDINMSRTNVTYIAKNLMNKLKSKNINKVIVYGHKDADLDALGSSWGIYKLAKSMGKEAYIQNKTFDDTTQRIYDKLEPLDKQVFISPKEATNLNDKKTLVVICDTSDETRIENIQAFKDIDKENIIVIDHHRIGLNPKFAMRENLYIDSSASSASEIVTEIIAITNSDERIDVKTAQHLLNGIYLDTKNFQKQTSSKTFSAAALLEKWGAKISVSVNNLKFDEKIFEQVAELLENLEEIKDGFFLAYKNIPVAPDVISIAADEILRVNGRKAAFVVAKLPGLKRCKMSARGIETNVQLIAENVGGGGHFGTAAAESDEDIELFVNNLKQAIVSVK